MKMAPFAFGTTDWSRLEPTEHKGETGMATWRTCHFGAEPDRIRVRMVEYTPGYLADHWCKKDTSSSAWKGRWRPPSKTAANLFSPPA